MAYAIMKDADQNLAALIDPDAGRTLGPLLLHDDGADDGARLLEAFVGGLGVDPATMTPWKLDLYWDRFLETLTEVGTEPEPAAPAGEEESTAVQASAQAAAEAAIPGPLNTEPEPADTDQPAEEVTPPPGPAQDAPEGAVAAVPGVPTGEPVIASKVTCDKCDGFGTVPNDTATGSVPCPKCEGSGQMDAVAA